MGLAYWYYSTRNTADTITVGNIGALLEIISRKNVEILIREWAGGRVARGRRCFNDMQHRSLRDPAWFHDLTALFFRTSCCRPLEGVT